MLFKQCTYEPAGRGTNCGAAPTPSTASGLTRCSVSDLHYYSIAIIMQTIVTASGSIRCAGSRRGTLRLGDQPAHQYDRTHSPELDHATHLHERSTTGIMTQPQISQHLGDAVRLPAHVASMTCSFGYASPRGPLTTIASKRLIQPVA